VASLELRGVTRLLPDGRAAVGGVDLDVADGELVVLVGPSGSGKSTLLRMIVGLDEITEGDLLIGGERANSLPPRERDLAMVFQSYGLYPHLSVRENIAFPLRLARTAEAELRRRVEEAARELDVTQHLDRRPSQLSGVQRQRVAIARAVVRQPNAFLLDEPLSTVDAGLRSQMRGAISRLQRRTGITTLYVTHDQSEAMTLGGSRVVVLRGGRVEQVGTPRELYERPATLFVAGYLGLPAMNLLPATVDGATLRLPVGDVPLDPSTVDRLAGRQRVVAGIRPEHVEDAPVAEEARAHGAAFRARVECVDWTGSELFAHLPYRGGPEAARELARLDADLPAEATSGGVVARLPPASGIREGRVVEVWFDARRLHLFDPETGASLTRDAAP